MSSNVILYGRKNDIFPPYKAITATVKQQDCLMSQHDANAKGNLQVQGLCVIGD